MKPAAPVISTLFKLGVFLPSQDKNIPSGHHCPKLYVYPMMKYIFYISALLFYSISTVHGQSKSLGSEEAERPNAWLVWIGFNAHYPAEELENRFGNSSAIGLSMEHFWGKQQWFTGLSGYYGFGTDIKEDVLRKLRTPDGSIIGNDGALASVFLRQRYWYAGIYAGKVFGIIGKDHRSGIRVSAGAGIWQHWIRVQDDTNSAAQVAGDYVKGYDRMTNGPAVTGSVGYQHFSPNGLVNFHVSFEITKGWLTHQRAWNFAENIAGGEQRDDMMYGVKIAWALPFFYGGDEQVIFY